MKNLSNLSPKKGSNQRKKRLGRGIGSGLGKTAAKGHKGQTARKGGTVPPGFEGGQMPLYRRLPKRGFNNVFRVPYSVVNLKSISSFDAGTEITPAVLSQKGLISGKNAKVKLLGTGSVDKAYKISLHAVSESAKVAIEKAGGSVEIIKK